MRRIAVWGTLLLFFIGSHGPAGAQEAPPAPAHAPKLVCDEATYNFGERDPSDTVEHTFTLRNDGDLTLQIKNVRTSCGCTVASVSTKVVEPGETAAVVARLSLKNRRGRQRKAVTVESNDPATPRLSLYMEGVAVTAIDIQPPRLFFNQVDENEGASGTVSVTAKEGVTMNVVRLESLSDLLEAELETVEEGRAYRVHITTKTPLKRGPFRGNVRVHTDHKASPAIDISVSGTVPDELTVAPQQIVLAEKPEGVTRYVVIRPGKTREFRVEEVLAPDPDIEVNIIELPQNTGYQIRLDNVVATKELNGKDLKITTDVERKKEIAIPFRIIGASS